VRKIEIVFRHDAKRSDSSQRKAVFAVKLVDSIPFNDQFALVATRQVEVAHQAVARIVVVPVALIVHAGPAGVAISLAVFARITPSSVRHRPLLAWVLLFGLSVKTPWQLLRGAVQGSAWAPGRFAAAFSAWSCGNPGSEPLRRSSVGVQPVCEHDANRAAADQEAASRRYTPLRTTWQVVPAKAAGMRALPDEGAERYRWDSLFTRTEQMRQVEGPAY
jgi:hypothetical protein